MNTGKIVLSILAGAAAGAALGILFAPDKGASTRKKISEKGQAYAEELEERFKSFLQTITKKLEGMKEEAGSVAENGKTKTEDVLKTSPALK
jgi:gas vesicle protein